MAELLPPVVAVLIAETSGFSSGIGKAISDMGRAETAAGKLASVGKAAFLGLGVAAVGFAAESVKMAASFDQQMELVHTQAGASQAEVEALKNQVLALAPAVGIGPETLAEGLYHVESAGFRGKEAMDILTAAAKDTAIGMGDMETTSQALIGVMAAGLPDVENAADAAAYLNTTVGIGDMRMSKLAASIATGVLPSFKMAGLGMSDYSAALATLTDNVTPADEAATRLRMTISLMGAPSKKASDALATIGMTQSELAMDLHKPNGLLVAVEDLKKHLGSLNTDAEKVAANKALSDAFGGGKTSGAIMTLIGETDRLQSKYAALGTSASRSAQMQDAWASQQKQFAQQLHQLGAEAQVIGIKVGNFLIPILQHLGSWLAQHIGVVKILAVVIGSVLVAAMAVWTAAVIENTVAMLANPTTWIILAIVAAVALLAVGIYELVTHWKTVWGFIKRIAMDVWHWLVDAWHTTINALTTAALWVKSKIIDPIVKWFTTYFLHPIEFILSFFVDLWKFEFNFAKVIVEDFMKATGIIFGWLKSKIIDPAMRWLTEFCLWIQHTFVDPAVKLFDWLMGQVDAAWHRFLGVLNTVKGWLLDFYHWVDNTFIRPIMALFDKVSNAIGGVLKDLKAGSSALGNMGGTVANMLHFDAGGWVPGAPGAPQLAVVHGGEYVLSNDMLRAMQVGSGSSRYPFATGTLPAAPGTGGGGQVIQANLYMDGKLIHQQLIPVAQRYKARTGTTGLT